MKCELLQSGTTPCVSTLRLPNIIARDHIYQSFPLHTCTWILLVVLLAIGMVDLPYKWFSTWLDVFAVQL